jgi:hypothetical protein
MASQNPGKDYVGEAIPHESGHIIVGIAVGLPILALDFNFVRMPDGRAAIGDFATMGISPPDAEIPGMDPKVKASYKLYVCGGVAGNIYVGQTISVQGTDADRKELARFTDQPIEELAEMAQSIIHKRRRKFRRMMSITRQRFLDKMKDGNLQTGRYNLLTAEEILTTYGKD